MVNTDKADPFVLSGTQQGRWGRLGKLFRGMRGQIVEDFRFGNKFEHDGHSQFISPGGTKNLVEYTHCMSVQKVGETKGCLEMGWVQMIKWAYRTYRIGHARYSNCLEVHAKFPLLRLKWSQHCSKERDDNEDMRFPFTIGYNLFQVSNMCLLLFSISSENVALICSM